MDIEKKVNEQVNMIREMFGKGDAKRDANLTVPTDLDVYRDIVYNEQNLLDVYMPKKRQENLAIIVNVHGGGYVYGTKETYQYYGMFMAEQGFLFVNANYSLAPENKFPIQLKELCQVLNWLEENQEMYDMDIENVFLVGDSAGAQMASQLGAIYSNEEYAKKFPFQISKSIKIKAIALNCGMYDLRALSQEAYDETEEFLSNYIVMESYLCQENRKDIDRLDVLKHINEKYPPCFVMTSYYDFLKECAKPFYELLCEKGVESTYKIYGTEDQEYMGHVFHCNMNLEEAKECNREEAEFFKKYIN